MTTVRLRLHTGSGADGIISPVGVSGGGGIIAREATPAQARPAGDIHLVPADDVQQPAVNDSLVEKNEPVETPAPTKSQPPPCEPEATPVGKERISPRTQSETDRALDEMKLELTIISRHERQTP